MTIRHDSQYDSQTELANYLELIALKGGISRKIRLAALNDELDRLLAETRTSAGVGPSAGATTTCARQLEWLQRRGVRCIRYGQPEYPPMLAATSDAPIWLFALGRLELLAKPCLAIVGSRRALSESIAVAREIAARYAQYGGCVVSGLAAGVDAAAHQGALDVGGATCAVYGCGLDFNYPKQNTALARAILETGVILSEYPPFAAPRKHHFPERNRVIAGICEATLAIEASQKSGSLITAKMALENGRDVLSVPGPIWTSRFQGSNFLIQKGAKLVAGTEDVLEELASVRDGRLNLPVDGELPFTTGSGDPLDSRILKALADSACSVEQIAELCEISISDAAARLTMLEIEGTIQRSALGYRRAKLIS